MENGRKEVQKRRSNSYAMSQLLDSHVTDLLRISSQYALGPKPVLVLLGLCGSHWQKVLIGKDPVDKGMQYSRRWHGHQHKLVSKSISGSHIRFIAIGNIAHMLTGRKGRKGPLMKYNEII